MNHGVLCATLLVAVVTTVQAQAQAHALGIGAADLMVGETLPNGALVDNQLLLRTSTTPTAISVDNASVDLSTALLALDDAALEQLSQDISWRRLLLFADNKVISAMPDANFFVAETGQAQAKDELIANLQWLAHDVMGYVCRYPARAHWLGAVLGVRLPSCPDVDAWMNAMDVKNLSLIYAEEHINRLGSSFAHTLIRMDTGASLATNNAALAYSLNFASRENPPKGEDTLMDSLRGTAQGVLTIENYEEKQNKYLLRDGRDIWQYSIDLTSAEIDQVMRHVWEIRHAVRYYSFTQNNCATEVMRFIDLVRPQLNLLAQGGRVVSPQEAANIIAKAGVITKTSYVPAAKTLKQAQINASRQGYKFDDKTLLPSNNNPVDLGTKSHRATFYGGQGGEGFFGMSVRGAYQDLLDRPQGKRDYLNMEIAGLDLRHQSDERPSFQLHALTLVDVLALNPVGSSYAGKSWGGHVKAMRMTDAGSADNQTHLVASIGAAYGHSISFGRARMNTGEMPNALCYALATAGTEFGRITKGGRAGIGARLGCVHHVNDRLRMRADIKLPYWYHTDHVRYWQPSVGVGIQYDLGVDNAVRFEQLWQKNHNKYSNDWQLAYVYYF